MKTPLFVMLVVALLLLSAGGASAQPNIANQTVNLNVPAVLRVSVTPASLDLTLQGTDFTPGTDQSATITDGSTTFRYVHNNATDAAISVNVQAALPAGVNLSVELSGGVGPLPLTTSAVDALTGLARGAGNGTATYSFSALASSAPAATAATVVFTLHN